MDGGALLASLAFLCVYAVCAAAAYLAMVKLHPDPVDKGLLAAMALVIGPLAMAWTGNLLLTHAPATLPSRGYVLAPLAATVAGFFVLRWLGTLFKTPPSSSRATPRKTIALRIVGLTSIGAVAVIVVSLTWLCYMLPMFGNDTLEYASAGRLIAETRSMANYPFVDRRATDGLVTFWTHPPAYVTVIAQAFLVQGQTASAGVVKHIAPYFALVLSLIVIALGGRAAGPLAAAMALSVPIYFDMVVQSGVDPLRMAAFMAAIAATYILIRSAAPGAAIVCGLACGAAGFTHSIGVLTVGFAIPAYLLLSTAPYLIRARNAAIVAVIAGIILAPALASNLERFGVLLQDKAVAWSVPVLRYPEHLAQERWLDTPVRRWLFGVFRGFTEPQDFSYVFSLAAALTAIAAVAIGPTRLRRKIWPASATNGDPAVLCIVVLGGFFLLLIGTAALGSDTAIKNPRYVLTVAPLACIVAARLLLSPLYPREAT